MLPIIRLATKYNLGSRATTLFRRRYVSGPTKDVDSDGVNDLAQHDTVTECSPTLWMNLREQDQMFRELAHKIDHAPDRATCFKVMENVFDYIVDDFTKVMGHPPEFFRKPVDLGDPLDQEASGLRIFNATKALLAKHGKTVEGLRFAIQGFGNVGSWIARLVHEQGGKVVAVSDITWALENKEGLAVTALLKRMGSKGKLADFSNGDLFDAVGLLTCECDVLIPGALGKFLNRKTAADVKAKFVIETADYTNNSSSREVLSKRGVVILPDIYTNSRRDGIDYWDWLKTQGFTWGKDQGKI